MSFSVEQIEGVMPALITPYQSDGSVNYAMVRRLVEMQLEQGACGFFVCGSTGEGLLLTTDERKRIARTVIETVAGEAPVIVHVGALSTNEAVALARDAKAAGAAAVSSIPPIYYKVGLEGMLEHIRAIARAAELPTFYYHIPELTGVVVPAEELADAFLSIEGVAGLKYTHFDMFFLWSLLEAAQGKLKVFNGADQMLFHGLSTGACGGIGSTYNYQMAIIRRIYDAVRRGDLEAARQAQWEANQAIRILFRFGPNLATEKAIMRLHGFEVGPPRGPIAPLPEDRLDALRHALEAIGRLS